jgi:hypothetical protein
MRRILRKLAEGEVEGFGDITTLADPSVVARSSRPAERNEIKARYAAMIRAFFLMLILARLRRIRSCRATGRSIRSLSSVARRAVKGRSRL